MRASQYPLPGMIVDTALNNRRTAAGPLVSTACSTTSTASTAAESPVGAAVRAAAPTLLPSEAALATRAGVLGLVVETFRLLWRGGHRAPSGHSIQSRWRLRHGPKEAAFLSAGHKSHGGGRGCSGTVVYRPTRAVDARQLDSGVLEQSRQKLQRLVDPQRNVRDSCRQEVTVVASGQSTIPRLYNNRGTRPDGRHPQVEAPQ